LICWSEDGSSFVVLDEDEFAKTLIPELFKHNNYASFVRQLNMYGFHKKVGLSDNSMKASEAKSKAPSEYYNKYFRRGRPELLWLIQKPKNAPVQPKRVRPEDAKQGDSDEDPKYPQDNGGGGFVEELAVGGNQDMAMIPRTEYNNMRQELRTLQQQQKVISNVLGQFRRQNDQLYQQATAFQTLHDRHENSINAILTFLATFYSRNVEGSGNIDFAQFFAPAVPAQPQHGNVVDVGDYTEKPMSKSPQIPRPTKRTLLLPAPALKDDPAANRVGTVSPSVNSAPPSPLPKPASRPSIFKSAVPHHTRTSPDFNDQAARVDSATVTVKTESGSMAQRNMPMLDTDQMMSAIQNANATTGQYSQTQQMDLPAALNNYQTQDGNTPLTQQQRNDVLSLMANNTSAASPNSAIATNTNNALVNPRPPPMPDLSQFQHTQSQLEILQQMSEQQNSRVQSLQERLQPLSPSGQIPGLEDGSSYFDNAALGDPGTYDLDTDLFTQGNDFFPQGNNGDSSLPDLNYPSLSDSAVGGFDDGNGAGAFDFGGGVDDHSLGVHDAVENRVESVSSSATSPAATVEEVEDESRARRSPKRRRK
jgi:heat shock transcription factor